MPRTRRAHPSQAATSLPSSRLPLGTPSLGRETSSPVDLHVYGNRTAERSFDGAYDSADSEAKLSYLDPHATSSSRLAMSSGRPTNADEAASFAAAKLERQTKRIEAVNATLTSQSLHDKQKQAARAKGKIWKPFDFTEPDAEGRSLAAGAPVVESRVNIFRAAPQGGGLSSRPGSRISTHTFDSNMSESENRDPNFLESDDFQLFTRKRSRQASVQDAKSASQPAQYPTVEATFRKVDITEVFGNELPGPEFLAGNPGNLDGQVQFIQHPNGDVFAHQWSFSRFEWENIGHFSNIRKKIEGGLAADRLKGETAGQSLQQNTLAYFRTVAKQREAKAMGLHFGMKEIAACLPDIQPPSEAPTGPRRITSKVEMPERPSTMMPRQELQPMPASLGNHDKVAAMPPQPAPEQTSRTQIQPPQLTSRFNPALNFTPTPKPEQQEDPFVSATPSHGMHGTGVTSGEQYQYGWPQYNQPMVNQAPYSYGQAHAMPNMGYSSYGYAAPPSQQMYGGYQHVGFYNNPTAQPTQMTQFPHHVTTQYAPPQTSLTHETPAYHTSSQAPSAPMKSVTPVSHASNRVESLGHSAQHKTAPQSESRTAMREQVMKMSENARKRSKSRGNNARTVLYDPFQDQTNLKKNPRGPIKENKMPAAVAQEINPLSYLPQVGVGMISGSSVPGDVSQGPMPTSLAPSVQMPAGNASARQKLRLEIPNKDGKRKVFEALRPAEVSTKKQEGASQGSLLDKPLYPKDGATRAPQGSILGMPLYPKDGATRAPQASLLDMPLYPKDGATGATIPDGDWKKNLFHRVGFPEDKDRGRQRGLLRFNDNDLLAAEMKPTPQPQPTRDFEQHQKSTSAAAATTFDQWEPEILDDWLWSGNKFARQEEFTQRIETSNATLNRPKQASDAMLNRPKQSTNLGPIGPPSQRTQSSLGPIAPPGASDSKKAPQGSPNSNILTTRLLVPVLETLASYVQGPEEKRKEWCGWGPAPHWALDKGPNGNDSFFDEEWGEPPTRIGRDASYQPVSRQPGGVNNSTWSPGKGLGSAPGSAQRTAASDIKFGSAGTPTREQRVAVPGTTMDKRFGFGGRF